MHKVLSFLKTPDRITPEKETPNAYFFMRLICTREFSLLYQRLKDFYSESCRLSSLPSLFLARVAPLSRVLASMFEFKYYSLYWREMAKSQSMSFHQGLHTFLVYFVSSSGSIIAAQSKGSISLPVYSCSATMTPRFSCAVVKYMPRSESPKLTTLAFTISLGLKLSIITTESTIFYLTFSLRIAPSSPLPPLAMQLTRLTCKISIMHYQSLTRNTLPQTISPTVSPIFLVGKLLEIEQETTPLAVDEINMPKAEAQTDPSLGYSPQPKFQSLCLHIFNPGCTFLFVCSCIAIFVLQSALYFIFMLYIFIYLAYSMKTMRSTSQLPTISITLQNSQIMHFYSQSFLLISFILLPPLQHSSNFKILIQIILIQTNKCDITIWASLVLHPWY